MHERPKVGVGVIVIKDGLVLLGKRINAHGENTWCFPGGHLEYGETWEECARREALEEAGITLKNVRFGAVTNDLFAKEGKHYITIEMVSEYADGEVRLMEPDKFKEWGWFEWSDMPKPNFGPIENLLKSGFDPFL